MNKKVKHKYSNSNNKMRVLYLGSQGFPFGSATIQRQIQLAKSLIYGGFDVTVVNNRSLHSKFIAKRENMKIHGFYQGIQYLYSSLLPYRSSNFFIRNSIRIIGIIVEFLVIAYFKFFKRTKYILLRTHQLKTLKYYYYISRLFNLELIYDYVEFYDSLGNRNNQILKSSKYSFDYNVVKYVDKLIVISAFLEKHVESLNSDVPLIKIPPIIDFSYFENIQFEKPDKSFFLFCGSAVYDDVIKFIIHSFIESNGVTSEYKLKLVINGDSDQLEKLHRYIKSKKCEGIIEVLFKLPYLDLIKLYKSANALLIPISNNLQDQARFPFKICEYTASKRPIITSDSGAIKEYFEDNVNAFIAKTNDINDFTNKLNLVIKEPENADIIGRKGYELGKSIFNYKAYSSELKKMLLKNLQSL